MGCDPVKIGDVVAIVCSRAGMKIKNRERKCCVCKAPATLLCDGVIAKGRTCDKPLCRFHAFHEEPDRDYCPKHTTRDLFGFVTANPKGPAPG